MYAPKATLPAAVEEALTNAGMGVAGGVAYPSEAFGETTVRHLGSLLSWAASAARYPSGRGEKLRSLGVTPVNTDVGSSWLQVLVGRG